MLKSTEMRDVYDRIGLKHLENHEHGGTIETTAKLLKLHGDLTNPNQKDDKAILTVMARNTSFIFIYKSIITYYNPIYGIISP